ncbi:MAG: hypothetical protein AB7E72_01555 [Lysobacterales bacterium]
METLWNLSQIFVGLLISGVIQAQSVPPSMNYQGHLTNATGQPLANGQYTLTFDVYNVPIGGSAVWGPQTMVVDVVNGYFNVLLSADSTGGDPIATAFTAQPRYVGIRVDGAAEILPRQQVLSAAFAMQALRASGADSANSSIGAGNEIPAAGYVGIGTIAPSHQLSIVGDSRFTGDLVMTGDLQVATTGSIFGTLSASRIQMSAQKWCRSQSTSGNFWTATYLVPSSWTIGNCRDFSQTVIGGTAYLVGCIFGDGTGSAGPVNSGAPARNCGW